jgi:DNA invertase Pin-like site-specific DNA recombinase
MIERSMKRDGRTFDHQTREAIRMMAVERVREGEHPADVIASYGFNRTTIYRWLNAAHNGGEEVSIFASMAPPVFGLMAPL